MKILIINGPNLNLLGTREPHIYGDKTLEDIEKEITQTFASRAEFDFFQSNTEGLIIDKLQEDNFDALIINPGAFTHYSYAIADCLKNINKPKIEIHISNIYHREEFRQKSVTASSCNAAMTGFGTKGYLLAVRSLFL